MRAPSLNKASKDTAPCGCNHCRAVAEGLPPGPYTPAQIVEYFGLVEPTPDPIQLAVKQDPEVIASWDGVVQAQALLDVAQDAWMRALSERHSAEILRTNDPRRSTRKLNRLRDTERRAGDIRDAAHAALVKANGKHHVVRLRAHAEATRAEQAELVAIGESDRTTNLDYEKSREQSTSRQW